MEINSLTNELNTKIQNFNTAIKLKSKIIDKETHKIVNDKNKSVRRWKYLGFVSGAAISWNLYYAYYFVKIIGN